MKKIAIALVLAFGVGALGFATSADAAKVSNARFAACWKQVMKQRAYAPGAITLVDRCSRGMPW
jgi:hypothetical protein